MKTLTLGFALSLILSVSGSANAQRGDFERRDRPEWRESNRNADFRDDRRNSQLFCDAKERIDDAQARLRRTLPVYGRSRGEALEQSVRAEYELNQALFGNRRNDFRRPMSGFDRDRDWGRSDRFSERDIRRSNGELIEARRELQRAEDILERARPDYAGHRRDALDAVRRAIREIDEALRCARA
jgi:hypothetical protein